MAKISAHGAHKVAEYRKSSPDSVEQVLAACSDGRILHRAVYSGGGCTHRTGYSVLARVKKDKVADLPAIVDRFAARRGFVKV